MDNSGSRRVEVHTLVHYQRRSQTSKDACCLCRGPQTDLAPLIGVFPSAARPELRPFTAEELQAAFALQPGAYELPEVHALPVVFGSLAEGVESACTFDDGHV